MNKQTFQLIMASKGQFNILRLVVEENPQDLTPIDRVKLFMSISCGLPLEHYTSKVMDELMFDAMCDYIHTCDNAGEFIRSLKDIKATAEITEGACIAIAFELVQVKQDVEYINGFKAYFNDALVSLEEEAACVAEFVKNTAAKLNDLKDYAVGYEVSPRGTMLVQYKNVNYLVRVQALDYNTLESDMKTYADCFR